MPASSFIAKAETIINTGIDKVWNALVNPEVITKYMFGAKVQSDWKKGSKITWKGEWQGKAYEDKGEILEIIPGRKLQYSHFSPLTGLEDKPENYHVVTIDLTEKDHQTRVSLSQDNNETAEAQKHSEKKLGNDAGKSEKTSGRNQLMVLLPVIL